MAVSNQGLTKCGQCGTHYKADGACPFCAVRRPGRGGVIAAGLLSLGLTAGCDDDDNPEPDPEDAQVVAPDMVPAPLYGIAADMGPPPADMGLPPNDMSAPQPDMAVAPLYGAPPDDAGVPDMAPPPPDMEAPTPDSGVVPPYGIPPQADASPPEPDGEMPVPLYGIPPGGSD